jgi:hypothetical protein
MFSWWNELALALYGTPGSRFILRHKLRPCLSLLVLVWFKRNGTDLADTSSSCTQNRTQSVARIERKWCTRLHTGFPTVNGILRRLVNLHLPQLNTDTENGWWSTGGEEEAKITQ